MVAYYDRVLRFQVHIATANFLPLPASAELSLSAEPTTSRRSGPSRVLRIRSAATRCKPKTRATILWRTKRRWRNRTWLKSSGLWTLRRRLRKEPSSVSLSYIRPISLKNEKFGVLKNSVLFLKSVCPARNFFSRVRSETRCWERNKKMFVKAKRWSSWRSFFQNNCCSPKNMALLLFSYFWFIGSS